MCLLFNLSGENKRLISLRQQCVLPVLTAKAVAHRCGAVRDVIQASTESKHDIRAKGDRAFRVLADLLFIFTFPVSF